MTHTYLPRKGFTASYKLPTGVFVDVAVKDVLRGRFATIELPDSGVLEKIPLNLLFQPLAVDVNTRFEYFRQLTTMVIERKIRSEIVTGEGAIGKSHTVKELLEFHDLVEDDDYLHLKGYSTARALYDVLRENNDKLFVLDDFDSALSDVNARNILKGALDTYDKRTVHWMTARGGKTSFEFKGAIIFLTNKTLEQLDQALLSRSIVVDLYMSIDEKIERMEYLLPTLDCCKLTMPDRLLVLQEIDKLKDTINNLNLRTLIKALVVYENSDCNMELVRYQILNG